MMNSLRLGVVMLAAVGVLAGCASRTENPAWALPEGWDGKAVTLSARYVRIDGAMPEAKGALAFLGDEAGLKAGTVVMTKAEADDALLALTRFIGGDAATSETVTVPSAGQFARLSFPQFFSRDKISQSQVRISVGGVEHTLEARNEGVELMVWPQITADEALQVKAETRQTTFEGFVEYMGDSVKINVGPSDGISPKENVQVPSGFYQPIFATDLISTVAVRMKSGKVVVIRADPMKRTVQDPRVTTGVVLSDKPSGSLIVFLMAELAPKKKLGEVP